jgi:hypothetical protein
MTPIAKYDFRYDSGLPNIDQQTWYRVGNFGLDASGSTVIDVEGEHEED